ncbi:MAG TPA: calcium-binding protein, partial [Burkholderiaceae bacterium]|nr:calcium-binding protein [Burkholderiaceae bacterium]
MSNTIVGTSGDDTLDGTAADDIYLYGSVTYSADGTTIVAAQGFDTIDNSGGGYDTLSFGNVTSLDYLYGRREGNDFVIYLQPTTSWNEASATTTLGGVRITNFFTADGSGVLERVAVQGNSYAELSYANGVFGARIFVNGTLVENNLDGANANDTLFGENDPNVVDYLSGNGGNDTIFGYAGNDVLDGGDGNDNLQGDDGNDAIYGGAGSDFIVGGSGQDSYDGGADNDVVLFEDAPGGVTIDLTLASNQVANDGWGNTEQMVNVENLHGSRHDDVIRLGNAGAYVFGRAGNDALTGGNGSDNFIPGSGSDTVNGGGGNDTVSYSDDTYDTAGAGTQGVTVDLTLTAGTVIDPWNSTDNLSNVENVVGTQFNDTMTGNGVNNVLTGGGGADTLRGGGGNDTLFGGQGSSGLATPGDGVDTLYGEAGNDILRGNAGDDQLFGGDGDDNLRGDAGDDLLDGGAGSDFASYRFDEAGYGFTAGVTFDLSSIASTAIEVQIADLRGGIDTVVNIESFGATGTAFADTLTGSQLNDQLVGNGGGDTLDGQGGDDQLDGGAGNDTLRGGTGADTLSGGAGNDFIDGGAITDRYRGTQDNTLTYAGAPGAVNVNLATGAASDGEGGTDTIANISSVIGSAGNDTLVGSSGTIYIEIFTGGAGNDTIDGGALTDTLNGTDGNRVVYNASTSSVIVDLAAGTAVGQGNDTLTNINQVVGSNQADTLYGSDRSDVVEHFRALGGADVIDGRGGLDVARYDNFSTDVTARLNAGTLNGAIYGNSSDGDTLYNIEGLRGGSGNDTLLGGNPNNDALEFFMGNAGNDLIDGGAGFDRAEYTLSSGAVTVTLGGSGDGTALDGQGGTDTLRNIEAVRGSEFNDTLNGSDTTDYVEVFEGREGNDTIDGKGGVDRADYFTSVSGVNVTLGLAGFDGTAQDGWGGIDTLRNVENVRGSRDFDDMITGNEADNRLEGLGGNDTLAGGAGNDTYVYGSVTYSANGTTIVSALGFDTIDNAGGGVDTLDFGNVKADHVYGYRSGNDFVLTIQATNGWADPPADAPLGGVTIRNFFSNDSANLLERIVLADATVDVGLSGGVVNLQVRDNGGNLVENVLWGVTGNNAITGTAGNDTIDGFDGNDVLRGLEGSDSLSGGDGDDQLYGAGAFSGPAGTGVSLPGDGADRLDGGA